MNFSPISPKLLLTYPHRGEDHEELLKRGGWVGGVRKWQFFPDLPSTICADVGGWA